MRDFLVKISYVAVDGGSKNIEIGLNKDNGFNVVNDKLCIKAYADKIRVFVGDAVACENDMVDFNIICVDDMELDLDTGSIRYTGGKCKFTSVKINYTNIDGVETSRTVVCTSISSADGQVGYCCYHDEKVTLYYEDNDMFIDVTDAKVCQNCGKHGVHIEREPGYFNDVEIDLDTKTITGIGVKDINGNIEYIRNSFLNKLVVDADSIEFIEEEERAVIKSKGYTFDLSPAKVEVTTPSGKVKGSNASTGYGSRNIWCEEHNRVSLSRLWCIAKAMHYKALALYELDDYVHNHKLNNGKDEALLSGFSGLNTANYELCSVSENKCHGDAWHKVFNTLGLKLALSVYKDAELIRLINSLNIQAKKINNKRAEFVDPVKLRELLKIFDKCID